MSEGLMDLEAACGRVVGWLEQRVVTSARGDDLDTVTVEPESLFWLGRLAPEAAVVVPGSGHQERLNPCSIGIRLRPKTPPPWRLNAVVRLRAWVHDRANRRWVKTSALVLPVPLTTSAATSPQSFAEVELAEALTRLVHVTGLRARLDTIVSTGSDGRPELTVMLVNCSPDESADLDDTNLYEAQLELSGIDTDPFVLAALPDSFRYDRRVLAYGLNGGVEVSDQGALRTTDLVEVDRERVDHSAADPASELSFDRLADDPLPALRGLFAAFCDWGHVAWSTSALDEMARQRGWTSAMREQAAQAAQEHEQEVRRLEVGIEALSKDDRLLIAFKLMNRAMSHASRGRYDHWRPFQTTFIVSVLPDLLDQRSLGETVDTLWFPTGGGKTETYLGVLVVAVLLDRMRGKTAGITAWSRFPLRMLSLQQTQRFADALAGAELARRQAGIPGEAIGLGFFVGEGATPNRIKPDADHGDPADPDDEDMPERYRVLQRCPFCHGDSIRMAFNRRRWTLEHRCDNESCPSGTEALPFYVVDDEIYRFLPSVVVGTLDKAASIGKQAAMRGFVGSPWGECSEGHGFVYAPRSSRPSGCLVPGCRGSVRALAGGEEFGPALRLQDELHLLRDSLGAVDTHYEALLDHLQREICDYVPKVLTSSATLSGQDQQIQALYRRPSRVFPLQGPTAESTFWTHPSGRLERRYVALAPRGVTLEYAADRMVTELQRAVRRLLDDAPRVCAEIGIDASLAPQILSLYGTDVVYGSTLRDLEATLRSLETQVPVDPLVSVPLTGRVPFEEVRRTLERLEKPEADFAQRIHVVAASAMMSHGVDVDRLNTMVMLGLPLTTAEFIQTTARIGRRWPGLVFLLMKIGRERDAGIFRSFVSFVRHGDRFVEPIPITSRSRRVLAETLAGMVMARVLHVHERTAGVPLTTVTKLRQWAAATGWSAAAEAEAIGQALGLGSALDHGLVTDVKDWLTRFFRNLSDPSTDAKFPDQLCPYGSAPMMSLRDVEEQVPVVG